MRPSLTCPAHSRQPRRLAGLILLIVSLTVTGAVPAGAAGTEKPALPSLDLASPGLFDQVVSVGARAWSSGGTFQITTYDRVEVVQFIGQDVSSVFRVTGGERSGRAFSQGTNYRYIDITGSASLRGAAARLDRPGISWLFVNKGAIPEQLASLPQYPFQLISDARSGVKKVSRRGSVWTLTGTCRKIACTTEVTFDSAGRLGSVRQSTTKSGTTTITVLKSALRQPLVRSDNSVRPDELYI